MKVGTNLLTGGADRLDAGEMATIARQLAEAHAAGVEVLLVTSGAITAGRHRLGEGQRRHGADTPDAATQDVHARQVLAAVGQGRLMALWDGLLEGFAVPVAQALLTRRDLADRAGYLNARNTLLALLDLGVLPVVNENDVVATEEIRDSVIGDNDNLSALVANLVDADLLLMLTDVAGLFTAHPSHEDAELIATVEQIDEAIERAAAGQPGTRGTGGMVTKVQAARVATAAGAHVVIADGRRPDVIQDAISGVNSLGSRTPGTHFLPTAERTESRRRFLLSGLQQRGRITIDDGAAHALERDGKSLLPAGVVAVDGSFARGDVVRITTRSGQHLATGTVNYAAADVRRISGLHSNRIVDELGYEYGEEIVHRNNLVLV